MRCTRCDRPAYPPVLGRAPDGGLVFGWCRGCLDEEGYALVESTPATLVDPRRDPIGRRMRRARRSIRRWSRRGGATHRAADASRRLAALGVAGLMAAWALILAFVGGFKLIAQGDGKAPMLLTGAGVMAAMSLVVWGAVLGRSSGRGVALKFIQVASAVVAFGTLAWGVLHHDAARAPRFVLVAALALGVSWASLRFERKRRAIRPPETIAKESP